MKMELLAPVGDFESLKMAIYYGANAVYLGVKEFNARNNIEGFNIDNLSQAVDFAHLYDVKVYLAINILFKDEELQSALDVVREANNLGVDAFIIQDLGLAGLIKERYPSVELHASTQMAVHNLEGVKVLERLGFKRVVLSRETPLSEIKRIHENSDMEIEFFGQGALCVAFSGNCYMCSHLVNKSGNRGLCQQFCRLPYIFESGNVKKSGFLLSAKDISMLDRLGDLENAGVVSLKIEGRARRPFYVAQACKVYRKALDGKKVAKQDIDNLYIAFNRQFTPAYLDGNDNIISKIQGNNGLEIGVVKKIVIGKKFNEIFVKTDYNLTAPCGLKFVYNGQEECSIGAHDITKVGELYRITTTSKVTVGSKVSIIQDESLEKGILEFKRKLKVDIEFVANENKPLIIRVRYNDIKVEIEGDICQRAKTISLTNEQILKQLSRNETFEIDKYSIDTNNCYILNSSINKIRNNLYQKLQHKILEKYKKINLNKIKLEINNIKLKSSNNFDRNKTNSLNIDIEINKNNYFNFKIIDNLNNLEYCENIIYDFSVWDENDILRFDKYCTEHNCKGYIDLPNFATGTDMEEIKRVLNQTNLGVVANNLYALDFDCDIIGGQFLNVYNSYTANVLNNLNSLKAIFVEELKEDEIKNIETDIPLVKREKVYMTLMHCPFKQNVGGSCADCKFDNAKYIMNSGKQFCIKRKKIKNCVFLLKD